MGDCHSKHENRCCCSCHEKGEEHEHEHEEHDEFSRFLMETADEAWFEVLKEEIKKHILSTQRGRMEELAKIVSDANAARWKHKMEKKHGCREFKEKLCQFFGGHKHY